MVLYSSFQPPKAAAQATVSGFSNMKPEPWAGRGLTNGFCRPRLPTARHGRLQALGLSRHITTPNLAKVIPAMDHIDKHLTTACIDARYDPAIQAALAVGKQLLNKYYTLTDTSELYRIAMGIYFLLILSSFI